MQLGFIGTGEITSSIVTGLKSSSVPAGSIWLSPRNSSVANELAHRFSGISIASCNQEVLDHSDTVVIAVRPTLARDVLAELRFRRDHRVISVVAALSLQSLSALVAPAVLIARAVPLPSAAKRLSPTAMYPRDPVSFELFSAVGTVFPMEREDELDAFSAASATIASYYAFNQAIASWLEQQGVPAPQARDYISRLFFGVTTGAVESSERSFQSLAATHATAGGLNEQVLKHLVERGFLAAVKEALDEVLHRISAAS
jgi:pyrroline-5-carboxylate reductase